MSFLRIEMNQLNQLHGQFIFVKTYSDKESSDGFIFDDFKYGGAEDWDKAVSLETLACSPQKLAHNEI